jgi:hypothetical protein
MDFEFRVFSTSGAVGHCSTASCSTAVPIVVTVVLVRSTDTSTSTGAAVLVRNSCTGSTSTIVQHW